MGVLDRSATLNISDGGKMEKKWKPSVTRNYIIGLVLILGIIALVLILYLTGALQRPEPLQTLVPPDPTIPLPPSNSLLHIFKKGAVCADGRPCAEIGKKVLEKNGSAVDAALAAMFCNGLVNMQSMGLGGGFLMTIYQRDEKKSYTLNAREVAPIDSNATMFGSDNTKAKKGPLAIGVPGELKGYWEAHKKFGKLPWKEIVEPTVELCESGYELRLPQLLSISAMNMSNTLYEQWFKDENNNTKKLGDKVVPKELCKTLRTIAEKGGDDFYNGTLATMLLEDLKKVGSIIKAEDLQNYQVVWSDPVDIQFANGDNLYTVPPPGSGALLGFILNILDNYNFTESNIDGLDNTITTYHKIGEAFKYAYAKRTELGDTNFINITELLANLTSSAYARDVMKEINTTGTYQDAKHYGAVFYSQSADNGTAHISVLAGNGDAVSVTSTLNLYFGSDIVSEQTGITLNSVMDDFSSPNFINYFGLPGSPNNAIAPGKRPLSSMSPTIITNSTGDVIMVIGASGGTQITTGVAQVIMRLLWFKQNIKEAVDAPRLHHQLYPMTFGYEYGTLKQVIDGLSKMGHNMTRLTSFSVICALYRVGDTIYANADHRKGGDVYGLN